MIRPTKRIEVCEKDTLSLRSLQEQRCITQPDAPEHYRDKVVIKPWGHEFLIFENEYVAIWYLFIGKDHSTSMHCHPGKKTSLMLISGKGLCNTFRSRNFLSSGDSLILESRVFHSTKAMSPQGIALLEVETPPAKLDLVRLQDRYDRENSGYEGSSQMVTEDLGRFDHFCLDGEPRAGRFIRPGHFSIAVEVFKSPEDFEKSFVAEAGALYCVCRGALLGPDGAMLVALGDSVRGGYLQQLGKLEVEEETTLIRVTVFN